MKKVNALKKIPVTLHDNVTLEKPSFRRFSSGFSRWFWVFYPDISTELYECNVYVDEQQFG